jgi:hypothetical protein
LYGDLQGIVGKSLPEPHGLTAPRLDDELGLETTEESSTQEEGEHE